MNSGPVHPCPVCGDPNQACTNPHTSTGPAVAPQEEPTVRPPGEAGGTLQPYTLPDGSTRMLTPAEAARRYGIVDDEEEGS